MALLRSLSVSLILFIAGVAVLAAATDRFQAFTTESARRIAVLRNPPQVPAIALETHSGARINLADFHGRWLLVDFIYTRCMSYCLVLGGEFAQLQDLLAEPLAQDKVRLLSISFDPAHDNPERLTKYLHDFGSRGDGWTAARPLNEQDLARLEKVFGVTVVRSPLGFVHNAAIEIVDPRGRLVKILDMGDPKRVAAVVLEGLGE